MIISAHGRAMQMKNLVRPERSRGALARSQSVRPSTTLGTNESPALHKARRSRNAEAS
jgi:hypothetical protein